MQRMVILAPNLTCSKYHMLIQCNITQYLVATTGLSQCCCGHAVIVKMVWGSNPPANQVLNDQLTVLQAPFGCVSQQLEAHIDGRCY